MSEAVEVTVNAMSWHFTDAEMAAHDAEVRAQVTDEIVAALRKKFGVTNRSADWLRARTAQEARHE